MKINIVLFLLFFPFCSGQSQEEKINFAYPPLVMGSSWGNIFQRYFKLGDFETMIKLTSNESLNKYGRETIKKYYASMDFGYSLKLKSWTRKDNYYTLNYDALRNATHVIVRMVLIAGDSAKIVLPVKYLKDRYFLYK